MPESGKQTTARVQPLQYPIPIRALDTWWKFDLKRAALPGGGMHYTFRTLGSTCTNCGTPIVALLHAQLRPAAEGLLVEKAWIEFDEDDEGRRRMCEYTQRGEEFVEDLKKPAPFCGRTLEAAIASLGEINPAGCFCAPPMINHKWRQMLCAIHYGLSRNTE